MSINIYGAVFIPVALWIFVFRPQYLIPLLIVASAFGASPLVEYPIGSSTFEIKPYYFVTVLLAIRAWPVLFNYQRLQRDSLPLAKKTSESLIGFWKWGILSAFLFPVVFSGLPVIDPRVIGGDVAASFFLEGASSPLHWTFENLGQAGYLTLNMITLLYVGSREGRVSSGISLRTLRAMIIVVSLIAIIQSAAARTGWNVPYLYFEGGTAYAGASEFGGEGVRRVSSTFSEASTAGGFLAASTLGFLAMRLSGGSTSIFLILLVIVGLLLTTATTGYAAVVVGGTLLFLYFMRGSTRRRLSQRALMRSAVALVFSSAIVLGLLAIDPALRQAAMEMTLDKGDTVSFLARGAVDLYSVKLLYSTFGLGVGLGSSRPSSFAAAMVGNLGIVGTILFSSYIVRLFRQLFAASCGKDGASFALITWMLAGILISQVIALPDLSWPPLWALLILATGMLASQSAPSSSSTKVGVVVPVKHSPSASPEPA
jgi:hypothetical protein